MTKTNIRIQNLSKHFEQGQVETHIFQDLDLSIKEGEFVAVMGPSGSGKTTLLNLIGGIDSPDAGSVVVDGLDLGSASKKELAKFRSQTIGFIFQFYNLLPFLNAEDNVALPLQLTRLSSKEKSERVALALNIVGLSEKAKFKPSQLSGGQEQRVAIARSIVSDPAILLCDEPTGDLDQKTADEIMDLLSALSESHNKTIVMVTHDPRVAQRASRIIHFDKADRFTRIAEPA
ncbi:Lipoprotein-releasing system ATP-binding protein LolD [Pseudovibrio sp. FO-BEG1]|jgi:putative ABC transport system ATP-binding protein|uniref:Putative ABC transport system ATP-binding protein n=1 Tax=Pseudovibrio denitrificans TaxID=258256 RepID=A0A1I7DUX7_9HYPH|nr:MULTISPECIES: ABC transporter ATP-binding protein [Pseudovibrio]AEV37831.1 Lipoprotein-releasing system ATP-binding protein LolD [Pseudovibrio sp. FO-BEG1]KZK81606.1 Lipoprotein-releasing system ATP-binding protein LolD [Pseudovibrio sp. Ad46]SFU15469.1 putative ABC transport system ATP-binding protein [Pseudovibrio denitrificans]